MKSKLEIKHYSPSLLSINCPRRLILKVKGAPEEGLPADIRDEGIELHALIEQSLNTMQFTRLEERVLNPVKYLRRLSGRDVKTEQWLRKDIIVDGKKKVFLGRCDIQDNENTEIIDAKSGWNIDRNNKDYEWQLEQYAWFLLDEWEKVKTSIYWVRYDVKTDYKEYDQFDKADILHKIIREINRVDALVEIGAETAEPHSTDCAYCDWSLSCPKVEKLDALTDEQLIAEYIKGYNANKKLDKIVRLRMDKSETGRVDIDSDKFIGWYESTPKSVNSMEFLQLADEVRLPVETICDIVSVNMKKFDKLLKVAPVFENLPMVEVKSKWTGAGGRKK